MCKAISNTLVPARCGAAGAWGPPLQALVSHLAAMARRGGPEGEQERVGTAEGLSAESVAKACACLAGTVKLTVLERWTREVLGAGGDDGRYVGG